MSKYLELIKLDVYLSTKSVD